MTLLVILGLGGGIGAGLAALVRGLRPPRPGLAQALAQLQRPTTPALVAATDSGEGGWAARAGRPLAPVLAALGLPAGRVRRDLAVLGVPVERHLAEKATATLLGLLLVPGMAGLLALAGLRLPVLLPVWASLLLAAAGFLAPDLQVRTDAARRREEFRHALGSYLDLVVVALAGGAGVESALREAATVGHGWAFDQLRRALDGARLTHTPPWPALRALGEQLGVPALTELSAAVALAGAEGAKIRASLTTKATTLRAHQLADADTAAQAATERMSLPVVLLFAGFLVFIGYPALARVLTNL